MIAAAGQGTGTDTDTDTGTTKLWSWSTQPPGLPTHFSGQSITDLS